jgi:sterol desaturase/sphingolipid hydroxylase (fatty acid hydroxylase superfamily)
VVLPPWEILSPAIVLVAALVIIALERIFPYDRGQPVFRAGFFNDLVFYALVQSYLLGLVIDRIIIALDDASGLSRLHLVSDWPIGVQLAFFVVTHDLYIYLFHRLQHRVPLLWRIHEAHHSGRQVDWLSGARSHSLEILINQTIEFVPIVLLGAHPDVVFMKLALDSAWGMYIHSNIGARPTWLSRVLVGPELHRWHHATDLIDVNFGTKLAFWDRLFGTAYLPADRKPSGYGLLEAGYPSGFLAQQLFAFRRRRS